MRNPILLCAIGLLSISTAHAQNATFQVKSLTPETALTAARAAMEYCRSHGYQVAVAISDRAGLTQVLLRDRYAGAHTIEAAQNKAWTAASFRASTTDLAAEAHEGKAMSGLQSLPKFLPSGGGLVIEAGGITLGAIGVSGALGNESNDSCAKAGIKAITESIEFQENK